MPEQILAGKYLVQSEIARGGMGVIYKALDTSLNRIVAVKMVHAHLSGDFSFVERFLLEAERMAKLKHDNIVILHAIDEHQGTPLLVMEYFQGRDLRALTKNRPRLPLRDIVSITYQLANALACAHAHGIIHRDIKPANVMVDARGKTKLTDFGISRAIGEANITLIGQLIGTPEYMSPEQTHLRTTPDGPDGRSDLWGVGILLYEMLTGKTPFAGLLNEVIIHNLSFDQQELSLHFPSDIPSLLQGVVRDLLRRQPDERIPDADTLAAQLHEILYTLPVSPAVPPSSESDATVLVSPHLAENAPDKVPPDLPTVLAPGGQIETRVARSMGTESTRVPPPISSPRISAPSHLEETTVLPSQPRKSDSSMKPSPSSFRLTPLIVGGLVIVALLVGLIYYIAEPPGPDTPPLAPPTKTDPSTPSPDDRKTIILEARLKEREELMSKLEELVSGTAKRLPAERQTSECPTLKALLTETYGKLENSVRAVNEVRQELGRELLSAPARPSELDLPCEPKPPFPPPRPKERNVVFPDAQLSSLLEKFKTAYERRDINTLRTLSRFKDKESRERNIEVMFLNYTSFKTSIQNMRQTDDGATAQLVLDTAVSKTGETVSLPPLSRTFKLQISRQGDVWDKVIW